MNTRNSRVRRLASLLLAAASIGGAAPSWAADAKQACIPLSELRSVPVDSIDAAHVYASKADAYAQADKYAEAEACGRLAVPIFDRLGGAYQSMEARLNLADWIEKQDRWNDATHFLREALDYDGDNRRKDHRAALELGLNLNALHRYAEAEPFLHEAGPDGRGGLAESLEGQDRWAEAEPLRRAPMDRERLINNLRHQGHLAEVADIESRGLASDEAARRRAQDPAEKRKAIAVFRQMADLLEKAGDKAAADNLRRQAELGDPDLSPEKKARAQAEFQAEMLAKLKAEGRLPPGLDKILAAKPMPPVGSIPGGSAAATPANAPAAQVELAPPDMVGAPAHAQLGLDLAAAGQFPQAFEQLQKACPGLRTSQLVELPPALAVRMAAFGKKNLSAANCYRELAWVRANVVSHDRFDAVAFEAAQLATTSRAAQAVTLAAADAVARRRGAGPQLDAMQAPLAAMSEHWLAFFSKWTPEKLHSASPQALAMIGDMSQMEQDNRADVAKLDHLFQAVRQQVPEYVSLRSPDPIALGPLQDLSGEHSRLLKEDEALILWLPVPGKRHGLVFAVSKRDVGWASMSLDGDATADRVHRLLGQIDPCGTQHDQPGCGAGAPTFSAQDAWELHQSLLGDPAIQRVVSAPGIKTLVIVPSGVLTLLPPGLLLTLPPPKGSETVTGTNGLAGMHWLLRDKAIAVLPSVSSLHALRETLPAPTPTRAGADQLLVLADPDFAGSGVDRETCDNRSRSPTGTPSSYSRRDARASLPRLPCTREEADSLMKIVPGAVLEDRDAREAMLRTPSTLERLKTARIIDFATHGFVAGDFGLGEPGLALAAPLGQETIDDGLLTSSKISGFRLTADWVILSACNTAGPDVDDADGLSGLASAFFFAGAHATLMSHWRVNDSATRALIAHAVELRKAGASKAEALRQASLDLMDDKIRTRDADWRRVRFHPAIWAPFTLMGDPS